MNDKVFLDSNILLYAYSSTELNKRETARRLISSVNSFISTQVLQELCNVVTKKFKFTYNEAIKAIIECSQNSNLHINSESTIIQGCEIADRYGFSFYDSLIISAAIECNCIKLYSEDLQDGQVILGKLIIENPFK